MPEQRRVNWKEAIVISLAVMGFVFTLHMARTAYLEKEFALKANQESLDAHAALSKIRYDELKGLIAHHQDTEFDSRVGELVIKKLDLVAERQDDLLQEVGGIRVAINDVNLRLDRYEIRLRKLEEGGK